jgi:hypothetical protein
VNGDTWTDEEISDLKAEVRTVIVDGKLSQRGLAAHLTTRRSMRGRTYAAIYIKVRELMGGGEGWWRNQPVGRQLAI